MFVTTKAIPDTRERLIAAASQLFAERGFHGTKARDIATRAGVNLAAGNYHYGSKKTLYLEVLRAQFAETRALLEATGARVALMQCDITAPGVPERVVETCVETFGSVDILVNSAGVCPLAEVLEFGREQWDAAVAVNLTAAFEMSYEAARRMVPQRSGKIINVCSVFTFLGGRLSPAYAATKHGIAGLTKAYCDELAGCGIQVNGIAPGYYATALTAATRSDPESSRRVLEHIPADRWGEPADLMGAAVFLASRASDYVNGHILSVDGGYLVR